MRRRFERPDIQLVSLDGEVDRRFRLRELENEITHPVGEFRDIDGFRAELDAVVRLVERHEGFAGLDLSELEKREIAAQLHQVLTGKSGQLDVGQRTLYDIPRGYADRFEVRRK